MNFYKLNFFLRAVMKLRRLPMNLHQRIRVYKYKLFSDAEFIQSSAQINQPVLLTGLGKITLEKCSLGVWPSPYFINGYIHIEARNLGAEVIIADGVFVNNNAVIIADRTRVSIGKNTLIGTEFTVYDSDFHELHPERRMSGNHAAASVTIGENVFIGSRVTILKGVTIGNNAVISAGSVVASDVAADMVAGGLPAKVIGSVFRVN